MLCGLCCASRSLTTSGVRAVLVLADGFRRHAPQEGSEEEPRQEGDGREEDCPQEGGGQEVPRQEARSQEACSQEDCSQEDREEGFPQEEEVSARLVRLHLTGVRLHTKPNSLGFRWCGCAWFRFHGTSRFLRSRRHPDEHSAHVLRCLVEFTCCTGFVVMMQISIN